MLTGVTLARRTADRLLTTLPHRVAPALESGFECLFDGTVGTFSQWRGVGPNAYALIDGEIVTSGTGDFAILFYGLETFGNFILRMRFRLTDTLIDNSGVFIRFRNPLLEPTAETLNRMTQASIAEKQIRPDLPSDLELFQGGQNGSVAKIRETTTSGAPGHHALRHILWSRRFLQQCRSSDHIGSDEPSPGHAR